MNYHEESPVEIINKIDSNLVPNEVPDEKESKTRKKKKSLESENTPEDNVREKRILDSILRLLEQEENKLGEGGTAEVFFPNDAPKLCYKIIRKVNIVTPRLKEKLPTRYQKYVRDDMPWHLDLTSEAELMEEARKFTVESISENEVFIPRPLLIFHLSADEEINGVDVKETVDVIVMDRVSGIDLEQLMLQGKQFPENFDLDKFMKALRDFFEKINSSAIHHRDVFERNIMVGPNSKPYVIDFGRGIKTNNDPYVEYTAKGPLNFLNTDQDALVSIEKHLRSYLYGNPVKDAA
ncbi:MAG: AarF/UbiB family protein [bacterium]|nr:AarF/UbiB family protein [bacterium]